MTRLWIFVVVCLVSSPVAPAQAQSQDLKEAGRLVINAVDVFSLDGVYSVKRVDGVLQSIQVYKTILGNDHDAMTLPLLNYSESALHLWNFRLYKADPSLISHALNTVMWCRIEATAALEGRTENQHCGETLALQATVLEDLEQRKLLDDMKSGQR